MVMVPTLHRAMSHLRLKSQLAASWSSQARWTVLDTGFSDGQVFLQLWQSWRDHARRPAMLHYVGVLSQQEANGLPTLLPMLAGQCYDLEPGFHRILLENGQLSLTLCVGDLSTMLSRQEMQADSLLIASPTSSWDKWRIKALARCCKRGAHLLFCGPQFPQTQLLEDSGMVVTPNIQDSNCLEAVFTPRWQMRNRPNGISQNMPGRCAVVGSGIAGASAARALAARGWQVDVYEAQAHPGAGASGLPLGLVAPHHSADDSPRSRLSRHGTRLMLQHAAALLCQGQDWHPSGVLELSIASDGLADEEAELLAPPALPASASGWAWPMAYGGAQGLWHAHAAWIKPERLVRAWLAHPGIALHTNARVHTLERAEKQWRLCDAECHELGRADRVVFANAYGCVDLLGRVAETLAVQGQADFAWLDDVQAKVQLMHTMFGTLSFGPCPTSPGLDAAMPAFPVNGHGSFVCGVPGEQGAQWFAGSTFQSEATQHAKLAQEQAENLTKLQALLPAAAQALAPQFARNQAQAWQGSRCITHDRLPLVGPLDDAPEPTLWLCAGMGARGLSFSALCAELLAAWLGGEPLPVESNLAKSLSTRRLRRNRARREQPQVPAA